MKHESESKYQYFQNNINVTYYVINGLRLPMSERFFEVEKRLTKKIDQFKHEDLM